MRSTMVGAGRRTLARAALGALGVLVLAGAAVAEDAAAFEKARVGHFKDIGRAAHSLQLEIAKPSPDAAAIGDASRKIEGLAGEIPSWFPAGSGPGAGVSTRARAEIWTDAAGFRAKAAALAVSAQALQTAAAANDQIGLKSSFANLAQACEGCHASFRSGEH